MDNTVYQLRISLRHIRPTIWRRIAVPSNVTLRQLHWAAALSMGWLCYHLYEFNIDGRTYISDCPNPLQDMFNDEVFARDYTLQETVTKKGKIFNYIYDYGDWWEHRLVAEGLDCGIALPEPLDRGGKGRSADVAVAVQGHPLAVCLDGAGACPPEDVGGLTGFREHRRIMADPRHPDHEETKIWFLSVMSSGGNPDPATFSVGEANRNLRVTLNHVFYRSKRASASGPGCGYVLRKGF
jgi:hypothetical protein